MAYEMSGIVTFSFSELIIEGNDPAMAVFEVKSLSVDELLNYADDVVDVQVLTQEEVDDE